MQEREGVALFMRMSCGQLFDLCDMSTQSRFGGANQDF